MLSAVRELFAERRGSLAHRPGHRGSAVGRWRQPPRARGAARFASAVAAARLHATNQRGSEHELPFFMRTLNHYGCVDSPSSKARSWRRCCSAERRTSIAERSRAEHLRPTPMGFHLHRSSLGMGARAWLSQPREQQPRPCAGCANHVSAGCDSPAVDTVALAGRSISLRVAAAAAAIDGNALAQQIAALQSANLVRTTGVRLSDSIPDLS